MKRFLVGALLCGFASTGFAMQSVGPIQSGNSVWKIAQTYRPSGVSMMHMVNAIYRANPNVFPGGSQGPLRVGVTLQVPSTAQEVETALKTAPITASRASQTIAPSQGAALTQMQSTVLQLKQMVKIAQQSKAQVEAEVTSLNQQLSQLQAKNQQLQATLSNQSNSGFSWGWLWFALLALGACGVAYKRYRPNKKGMASVKPMKKNKPTSQTEPEVEIQENLELKEEPRFGEAPVVEETMESEPTVVQTEVAGEEGPDGIFSDERAELMNLIEQDPNNVELRLKLLELLVRVGDQPSFDQESKYVLDNMVEAGSPMWSKIRGLYLNKWVYDQ